MNIIDIIDKKRRGETHTRDELVFVVDGVMSGELPDYQLSAWLMAVCCNGLSIEETTWLTDLYVQSGDTIDFSDVDGVVVDKHSTGGVGDKTTLILAPMLAACGLKVAKLSGRGLGFTGGTIDKLEAIPGFQVELPMAAFRQQVQEIGVAIGSQTGDLTPADGKTYALRDVTATVASIPLIAASVVSKKIAAGAQVITLDIKVGSGAFMKSHEDAKALAFTCREVGKRLGRTISTVISYMGQPLGNNLGHTLEVMEAVDTLSGKGPQDLTDLCLTLGGVTLVDAGEASDLDAAKAKLSEVISSGRALQAFRQLIEAQQGNPAIIEDPTLMPQAKDKVEVNALVSGYVHQCDALALAKAGKALGAGRISKSEPIDLGVGIVALKKVGDFVHEGEPLVTMWCNDKGVDEARRLALSAYSIVEAPVSIPNLIEDIFSASEAQPTTP